MPTSPEKEVTVCLNAAELNALQALCQLAVETRHDQFYSDAEHVLHLRLERRFFAYGTRLDRQDGAAISDAALRIHRTWMLDHV